MSALLSRRQFLQGKTPQRASQVPIHASPSHTKRIVNANHWRLEVQHDAGLVAQFLTIDAVQKRLNQTSARTIVAPGNPENGGYVSTATWHGGVLQHVLQDVSLHDVLGVRFTNVYGERLTLPAEIVLGRDTFLAWGVAGRRLLSGEGGPLRVLIPGLYCLPAMEHVRRIDLLRDVPAAARNADYNIQPHIRCDSLTEPLYADRPIFVSGLAFAGDQQITDVAFSIDGGLWTPVASLASHNPLVAAKWRFQYTFAVAGHFQATVRAITADDASPAECHVIVQVLEPGA
jgi:DMSO/TMAO reductase YedYZ molybdopterin-dependent catalytic subunit